MASSLSSFCVSACRPPQLFRIHRHLQPYPHRPSCTQLSPRPRGRRTRCR
jgi:hypothetical protein